MTFDRNAVAAVPVFALACFEKDVGEENDESNQHVSIQGWPGFAGGLGLPEQLTFVDPKWVNRWRWPDVLRENPKEKNWYPCEQPLAEIERLVQNFSIPGEIGLIPVEADLPPPWAVCDLIIAVSVAT